MRFAVLFGDNALFGADLEQGIAGDGIERLEPAVHQDGQFAEFARVKAGLRFLVQRGQNPPRHHDDQNEGNPLFHKIENENKDRLVWECGDMSPLSKRGHVRALQISAREYTRPTSFSFKNRKSQIANRKFIGASVLKKESGG
jgi:hypothetical protein